MADEFNLPDTPERHFAEIERRLRALENAPRAPFTSIADDAGNEVVRLSRDGLTIYDAAGNTVLSIGAGGLSMFDDDGDLRALIGAIGSAYGVQVLDPGGTVERLRIDEHGILTPYLAAPVVAVDDFTVVTSGSFVTTHSAQHEIITSEGLFCWVVATADAGTTGEVRLHNLTTGASTDAVPVPDGGQVQQQFRWLHGANLSAGPVVFQIQARRASGAGNVNVYRSPGVWMTDPQLCVTDGVA